MSDPRPVRIARRPTPAPGRLTSDPDEAGRRPWDAESAGSSEFQANTGGTSRGRRLYVFFGSGLAIIFVLFLALAATSPSPGVSQSAAVYGWLSVITLLLALGGATITILRAPRGATFGAESVVVTGRLGGRRRWPAPPALRTRVVQRYPGSLLGPEPTELIELSDGAGHSAQYLVGQGFFDRAEPSS